MHEAIRIPDLIQKKRDNYELSPKEIRWFVAQLVQGRIEQVQLGKCISPSLSKLDSLNYMLICLHAYMQVY